MADFYAHTKGEHTSDWEVLEDHLAAVAKLAFKHGSVFGAGEIAHLAGLWHDLGKYRPGFQKRLHDPTVRCEHSGAGAAMAVKRDRGVIGQILAFIIAGHHAGLANLRDDQPPPSGASFPRALSLRCADAQGALSEISPIAPARILDASIPKPPERFRQCNANEKEAQCRSVEFLTRFLFSCLVDADRIQTEAFVDPLAASQRLAPTDGASPQNLLTRLEEYLRKIQPPSGAAVTPVARARVEVSEACRRAAEEPPGLFSLTVPTGGGKTLSAMRFALAHAHHHGLRRVIVVIPFTSIIEQNAAKYAEVLGASCVLEHHSNLDVEKRRSERGEETATRQELASENWDSPVVVTTTVQFFESLFSNHPSRCRKLHNITNSVVILDEVQSLPPQFLASILDSLRELTSSYGCSVVLSTATPPALKQREAMRCGLENVREIIPDPTELSKDLRRVTYQWPVAGGGPREWRELAGELSTHRSVLAIVHKRNDARELAEELQKSLGEDGEVHHLSALMCPAHRLEVLNRIRLEVESSSCCRVVSTQLVEAGVDLDFPVVYRAFGGLDSIVQAAGRCNREGKLEHLGRVVVFESPTKPPKGVPTRAVHATRGLIESLGIDALDPDDPKTQERYFRHFYFAENLDARNVQMDRAQFNFATVAHKFRLIEDSFTRSVIVPWGEEGARRLGKLITALRNPGAPGPPLRDLYRAVQPYSVSLHTTSFDRAVDAGAIEEVSEGTFALRFTHMNHYSEKFGLTIGDDISVSRPDALML